MNFYNLLSYILRCQRQFFKVEKIRYVQIKEIVFFFLKNPLASLDGSEIFKKIAGDMEGNFYIFTD